MTPVDTEALVCQEKSNILEWDPQKLDVRLLK